MKRDSECQSHHFTALALQLEEHKVSGGSWHGSGTGLLYATAGPLLWKINVLPLTSKQKGRLKVQLSDSITQA